MREDIRDLKEGKIVKFLEFYDFMRISQGNLVKEVIIVTCY